ncbi:MAG: hypothetical protein WBF13_12005 [Candidatus Zixiibacteriota bacterium]
MKSQKLKKILSCSNAKIRAAIGAMVVLALLAFACDSDTKTEAPGDQKKAEKVTADKTPPELKDFEMEHFGELTARYPLGWAYFVVDPEKKEIVSKGRTGLSSDFEIDWSKARVHDITAERVIYQLPDISYRSEENRTGSQMINFPRGVGTSPRVDFSPEGLDMWVQMLIDREGRPVAVMGFREERTTSEE